MKTLILTIPFALSVFCAFAQKQVYVCTGTGAYRYHYYKDCSGLNNCKASIVKMSEQEAKKKKNINGLCKKCAKRSDLTNTEHTEQLLDERLLARMEYEQTDTCYTCMQEMRVNQK